MILHEIIAPRRRERGLSQEGAARLACISSRYLGQIETGEAVPSPAVAQRLEDVLDLAAGTLTDQHQLDLEGLL